MAARKTTAKKTTTRRKKAPAKRKRKSAGSASTNGNGTTRVVYRPRPSNRYGRGALSVTEGFDQAHAGYAAAKASRFTRRRDIPSAGAGADWHFRSDADYWRILEIARDIDRNDRIVGQGICQLVDNVVQDGFRPVPNTGDEELNRELVERWDAWAGNRMAVDAAGECDFPLYEKLVLRAVVADGDVFVNPLKEGTMQALEAHRCRTPIKAMSNGETILGVERDPNTRRRRRYWFTEAEVDPGRVIPKTLKLSPTPAYRDGRRNLFHIYNPRRFSQTRGVTAIVPVIESTTMHDDLQFATLVRAQIGASIIFRRERERMFKAPASEPQKLGEREEEEYRILDDIAPGIEMGGAPGETLHADSPNVPNTQFFQHSEMLLRFIAVNLRMPLQMLTLDGRQTNFSGWRGAFDQAKIGLRGIQKWLCSFFHCEVWQWKLREWRAKDTALRSRAEAVGDLYYRHSWNPPVWPYLEPLKDWTANALRLRTGQTSPRRLVSERGGTWDTLTTEMTEDYGLAIRKAKSMAEAINKEFPDDGAPVHWRECLNLPLGDGVKLTLGAVAKPGDKEDADGDRGGEPPEESEEGTDGEQ